MSIGRSEQMLSPDSVRIAADVLSAVRYARPFFNQDTDLGKALVIVFDAATRYAEGFDAVPGVICTTDTDRGEGLGGPALLGSSGSTP